MNTALSRPPRRGIAAGAIMLPGLMVVALSGCVAPSQRYPSLLPRAVESQPATAPALADAPVTPVPADPALDAQLAVIETTLTATAEAFTPAAARATTAIRQAQGAASGSEAWLAAQAALAALETVRSQTVSALSDLDRLAIDRGVTGQPDYAALVAARARADAQLTTQQALIDSLAAKVAAF